MTDTNGSFARPELSLATWNIAAENQGRRVDEIAEYLTAQESGITILTELVEVDALDEALNREMGHSYNLGVVRTGSSYEDSIGLLVAAKDCELEEVEPIDTGGKKMPYIMKAVVSTPLGGMTIAALRGAYVAGKGGGTLSTLTGSRERQRQYRMATEVLEDGDGIGIIGGDMNALACNRDPLFAEAGYTRLTDKGKTWPESKGIKATTRDAQIIAAPFLLFGIKFSIDAIYGKGPIESTWSKAQATGLSDHFYLGTSIRRRDTNSA